MPRLVLTASELEPRPERNPHGLVEALVSARERRDVTQAEMARRCGVTRQRIQAIESGTVANPGADILTKMARALGLRWWLVESG